MKVTRGSSVTAVLSRADPFVLCPTAKSGVACAGRPQPTAVYRGNPVLTRYKASSGQRKSATVRAQKESQLQDYEGQADNSFAGDYLNPDKKQTDDSDVEYEHPADLERPIFHPMAQRGFMSDPCGPFYDPRHRRYHLFFQNVSDSIEWKFGISWGHVTSTDLVHWQHLPPALTPGKVSEENDSFFKWDADGCFTGCATIDSEGIPTILYTGVRLRNNHKAGPFPEEEDDTDLPFFEAQLCSAHADPSDEFLRCWTKQQGDALAESPPAELRPAKSHTGWRDPFLLEKPSHNNDMQYTMLIGNGSSKKGGRALVYRSKSLNTGWKYTGTVCDAGSSEHGCLWEYPVLAKLPEADMNEQGAVVFDYGSQQAASEAGRDHVFLTGPDAPVNPCLYWCGPYDSTEQKFKLSEAEGPYRFDMGEILYAVNSFKDAKGRQILFGWLQEGERDDHGYSYSGCQTLPRELMLRAGRTVQQPIEEIVSLREKQIWDQDEEEDLNPGRLTGIPDDAGNSLDIEATLERGTSQQAGIIFGSWAAGGRGSCALMYNWETQHLEAIFDTFFVCPKTKQVRDAPFGKPNKDLKQRRVGGPVEPVPQGDRLRLRVLLDGSCLEVFTHTGAALSTRIYRGMRPKDACCDIGFISHGGVAKLSEVKVWNMADCWSGEEEWREAGKKPCKASKLVPASKLTRDAQYGDNQVGRCKACKGLHREGECPVFKGGQHPGGGSN